MSNSVMFSEKESLQPEGFIGGFLHKDELEFVQVGTEPNQGYFRTPKEVIQEMHVNKASELMAKRMRPGTTWGAGIQYLELGTGTGTGTTQAPQAESASQTALRASLIRKAITSWTYLDSSGNPTANESNVIQLTTTLAENEGNGALVEMGLFGGDATTTAGTGYMFNYKTFPVWNKQAGMRLTIVWRLTF